MKAPSEISEKIKITGDDVYNFLYGNDYNILHVLDAHHIWTIAEPPSSAPELLPESFAAEIQNYHLEPVQIIQTDIKDEAKDNQLIIPFKGDKQLGNAKTTRIYRILNNAKMMEKANIDKDFFSNQDITNIDNIENQDITNIDNVLPNNQDVIVGRGIMCNCQSRNTLCSHTDLSVEGQTAFLTALLSKKPKMMLLSAELNLTNDEDDEYDEYDEDNKDNEDNKHEPSLLSKLYHIGKENTQEACEQIGANSDYDFFIIDYPPGIKAGGKDPLSGYIVVMYDKNIIELQPEYDKKLNTQVTEELKNDLITKMRQYTVNGIFARGACNTYGDVSRYSSTLHDTDLTKNKLNIANSFIQKVNSAKTFRQLEIAIRTLEHENNMLNRAFDKKNYKFFKSYLSKTIETIKETINESLKMQKKSIKFNAE